MDIQVLATNPQMEGLEGIKFAKFLKRATGSRRMSSALLKTGVAAAIVGGSAYYLNKKYGWSRKLNFYPKGSKKKAPAIGKAVAAAAKAGKTQKAAEKGANGWFNADLFKSLATKFLAPKTDIQIPQAQNMPAQPMPAQEGMKINPLLLAGLAVGGIMLLKK